MTISIWRYSHLALAVSSCIFIALASITGIILSFEAVDNKIPSYEVQGFNTITLAESLPSLNKTFSEITEISVDEKHFVTLKGFNDDGDEINAYIDPRTGNILGAPQKQSDFFKWVTALHRSLFLHEAGRFFIGLTSFLLLLIALSGIILVVQRQHGLRRFFSRVVKEYFAQYYHVVLGRFLLIPVLIIAITGVWLSLVRFNVFPEKQIVHSVEIPDEADVPEQEDISGFAIFKNTKLADTRSIVFPFAGDPEEYYLLKLKDREIAVNQFNGTILSEAPYPFTAFLTNLSLNLHTGRSSIIWAIVLAIASVNILFFIYSGFTITLKRRRGRIRNKYKAAEAKYIILAGSENGSTLRFAGAIHKQLLANNQISFLGEPNQYTVFPEAEHLLIFTSTYGLGDPPDNSKRLLQLIEKHKQLQRIKISVIGFGSHAYPDFCRFAKQVDAALSLQQWAIETVPLHTVNDKSPEEFIAWIRNWTDKTGIRLDTTPAFYSQSQTGLQKMMVLDKTAISEADSTFIITLHTGLRGSFTSGDLLAIYPANDARVRFYSIAKIKNNIQLVVKLQPGGLGSEFLYSLQPGSAIRARIIRNAAFHFPKKVPAVAMIANGTGIAPFLGMAEQNKKTIESHLYCGFRKETPVIQQYTQMTSMFIRQKRLHHFHIAFSREGNNCYVMDLIKKDADFFADLLRKGGVIMLCGSLAMQKDVEATLNVITISKNGKDIAWYKMNGQVVADCY
ncbi:MAG: PepSY domain-containing protein [Agriterribacter sp.]